MFRSLAITALLMAVTLTALAGVGMATGYFMVGEPSQAAVQVAEGNITTPTVEPVSAENTTHEAITSTGQSGPVLAVTFAVDNRANPIGGRVQSIQYQTAWARSANGPYSSLGTGEVDSFTLAPGRTITQESRMRLTAPIQPITATNQSVYLRITGSSRMILGPLWTKATFQKVVEISPDQVSG